VIAVARTSGLGIRRQLLLALFWFGISFVWGALLAIVLPFLLVPEHPGPGNPALVSPAYKNTALALLESLGLVVAIVVQPASGAISDRLRTRWGRRRPLIVVGALGAIASLLLIAVSQVFLILVAVYCLLQFFMNVAQGAYQGLLPDTVPGSERGTASGYLGIGTLSGQVAGALVAGVLSPRATVLVIAAVVAITSAVTIAGIREHALEDGGRPLSRQAVTLRNGLRGLRAYVAEFRRYPDFCWVVFSRFLMLTGLAGIQRFAANYIRDTYRGDYTVFGWNLGAAKPAASVVFAIIIFCGLLITYPAVRVSDRIGRRRVLIAAGLSGAVASLLFFIATSLTQVVLFAVFVAFCFGAFVSVDWAFMADLAPRRRAGKFLGFSNLATAGAQAAAPAVLGPIIDLVNRQTATPGAPGSGGYRVLFAIAAAFFVLGAFVLSRVRAVRIDDIEGDTTPLSTAALAR